MLVLGVLPLKVSLLRLGFVLDLETLAVVFLVLQLKHSLKTRGQWPSFVVS